MNICDNIKYIQKLIILELIQIVKISTLRVYKQLLNIQYEFTYGCLSKQMMMLSIIMKLGISSGNNTIHLDTVFKLLD